MKFNKSLLIISMVFILLFAVSAVSASEIADDAVEAVDVDDVDEIQAIDETDDVLSENNNDEIIAVDNEENVLSNGTGNGTGAGTGGFGGMGNGTGGFDMSSMMNMDWGKMFGGSSGNILDTQNLKTYYAGKTTFKAKLTDSQGKGLSGKVLILTANNKEYYAKTDDNGVATFKVKLLPGSYSVTTEFENDVIKKNKIVVKDSVITKNVVKKAKKNGKFTVKILNSKGKAYAKQTVKINFKGKTYKIKNKKKGIATFKIPKNLKKGKYTIKTTYAGLTKTNKITVK